MKFGEFPLAEAAGVALAHTLDVGARTLKKGRVLTADDVEVLRLAGIRTVWGARLEPDDADENRAAAAIGALLAGANTEARKPYTGRCNVHAAARGLVLVDAGRIDTLNLVDESVTVGTLPRYAVARKGQVVATVKIIPFAVSSQVLQRCSRVLADGPPVAVAAFAPHRAALIMSELPGMKDSVFRATVSATRKRMDALGSRLALERRGPHDRQWLAAQLRTALAAGCDLLLVSGATVAKDRGDVVPSAIIAAGGVIEHFGMPVEPGNMLVLARIGAVPVLALPGCARSRRMNGLDWVLHRLLARLPVTREDIMRLGVGGLIRSPLEPEDEEEEDAGDVEAAASPAAGRIGVLVLAAGRSSRMGGVNKLLAHVDGIPMVARAANAALASRAAHVCVITGHEAPRVQAALAGCAARFVHNPDYAAGMSTSLRAGLRALPDGLDAVIVMLADMPWISARHLDALIDAFDPAAPRIVAPHHRGRRGNPVLWPKAHFEEMAAVGGDQGARELLTRHASGIVQIEADEAIFADLDTPEALEQASRGAAARQAGPPQHGAEQREKNGKGSRP